MKTIEYRIPKNNNMRGYETLNKAMSNDYDNANHHVSGSCHGPKSLLSQVFIPLLFVMFSSLFFSSCQTPLRLAEQYIAELPPVRAAVYFPEKAEVKIEYNTEYERQTEVLNGFSQDLFLDVMYNAYAEMMDHYGVEVYVPDDIENVPVDSVHWLVMLSRMEISGRITEYEDYLFSDSYEYSYKHPLNTVNVASWFEINDGEWLPVLFCEHNLIDGFDSNTDFSFWTQKIDYAYNIDTLELKDVYNYAVYLGKLYAGYTYDYMINGYLSARLKERQVSYRMQVRYDPYKKQLRYAEEGDGFVVIE